MTMIFAPEGTTNLHDKAPRHLSATRAPGIIGYAVLALLVGGFGVWAATAPIAGAVIVEGAVTAQTRNRVIQHFEGGIVREVSVVKGERVKADETIYVIDDVRARAQLQRVQQQAVGLRAQLARLNAERLVMGALSFERDLIDTAAALDVAHLLDEQRNEFDARRTRLASDDEILNQRVAALAESIDGFEAQLTAIDEQIAIVREEASRKQDLLDRGLTNRSEYT
ncbi:MAG: biotin/lipoyl-binding protein, partial [Ahrensia sp.]